MKKPARVEMFPDAIDQASMDKGDRFWEQDPDRLNDILFKYNYTPILEVYNAYRGDQNIDGVKLPINWLADRINGPDYSMQYYVTATPDPNASPTPEPTPWPTLPLQIDDLSYFITNSKEMINDL